MRKFFLFFALLLPTLACAQHAAWPIKVSSNGRYFTDANGVPFLVQADAGHHIVPAIPQSAWNTYMTDRVADGFNTVDLYMVCGGSSGTCPTNAAANNGALPFTSGSGPSNYDLSTPNSAYWSQVDTLVQDAENAGLVIIADPLPWGNNFSTTMVNNGSTKVYNFGAFIGNRYKNYPNIVWMLGDDFDGSSFPSNANIALMGQLAAGIKSADANHILTVQLNYNESYTLQAHGINATFDSSVDFDLLYDYYELYDYSYAAYNASPAQPIWMGESNYETANNTGGLSAAANAFIMRLQSWWVMTAGNSGFEFGNEHINHFDSGYNSTSGPCSPYSCLDTPATLQQKYIGQLFRDFQWQNFVPDQTHQVVTAGYGTYNGSNLNLYTASYATTTWDGSHNAVIYAPVSTTLTVNMAKFSANVNAYWFDPTAGTASLISGSPFTNSGTHNFTSPAAHSDTYDDWVLVLTTTAQGACPTGSNYLSLTNPIGAKVALSSFGITSCYYIAANGSDSNNGNSELTPWKFSPGMPNCASNCLALQNAHPSGGQGFIFRGGDTWHESNSSASPYTAGGWSWYAWSGSSGSYVYVGVDPGWYSGGLNWARPIINADNPLSTSTVSSCAYQVAANPNFSQTPTNTPIEITSTNYIIFDDFEVTGFCWNSTVQNNGGTIISYTATSAGGYGNSYVENNYVHGWTLTTTAAQSGAEGIVDSSQTSAGVIRFNVIDGSDSPPISLESWGQGATLYDLEYNVALYGMITDIGRTCHAIHDNLFEYGQQLNDNSSHSDILFCVTEYAGGSSAPNLFYNNIFKNIGGTLGTYGGYGLTPGMPSGQTDYVFNNVIHDIDTGGGSAEFGAVCDVGSAPCGAIVLFNNTDEGGLTSGGVPNAPLWASGQTNGGATSVNNHWIINNGTGPSASFSFTSGSVSESATLYQTLSTANGQGYNSANDFSPTSSSGGTVTASGTNETTGYCADSVLHNAVAEAACKQGITGVSYNSTTHTVVYPAFTAVARPSSGAWNVGAYQFSGSLPQATTPTFSPVAGTYASAQSVTLSSSGSLICWNTTGATIVIGGVSTCPSGSTAYTSAITVSSSETIYAVGGGVGYSDSSVGSAAYVIRVAASTPAFNPAGGTFTGPTFLTLTSTGSVICYTTNGTTPATNLGTGCTTGTLYTTPIAVTVNETVKAVGGGSIYNDSSVGSATYQINAVLAPATAIFGANTISNGPVLINGGTQ